MEDEEKGAPDASPSPPAGALSAEELSALRRKASKAEEYLDLARRQRADFLNYQDRIRREKEHWKRQALESFVLDLLPALDGFFWARFEEPTLMESLRLVEREFRRVLAKHDIVPVETQERTFDPAFHEAVAFEEREDVPPGRILEEVRPGWRMGNAVLRPAAVRVAKEREAPEPPDDPSRLEAA